MSTDSLLARARLLWEGLAAVPVSFPSSNGVTVVVSPSARICPPGWAGVVALDGQAIVTAPSPAVAAMIESAVEKLSVADFTDPEALAAVLPVAEILGPATLAYVDEEAFRPAVACSHEVERLPTQHPDLHRLGVRAGDADTAESGLDEITSAVFVIRESGEVLCAAGYRSWPRRVAHLCVLTAPDRRGEGLARVTGSAAVEHALANGLLPQWRARTRESRRVAASLGFRELGAQLSLELT
ncbi:GNAT family N-acetyltransferase [Nocardia gipuzkoensis]